MTKFVTHITGARPNFPKAAPVISALEQLGIKQRLVHTGQHYDDKMSGVFFKELSLPKPDVNLGVGSGSHAAQTAQIMVLLEQEFKDHHPDLVIVYGDVNSTVAASLVAAKLQIPTAHVEAGLRSFDARMPEEINRLVTDQLASLLFVTSPDAIGHLADEGVDQKRIHFVGNPMIDTLLKNLDKTFRKEKIDDLILPERYIVATLHRPSNVDNKNASIEIIQALHSLADLRHLIVPLHPRGRVGLIDLGFDDHKNIHIIEPLGYLDFVSLVRFADAVVTDSGGVQEETTILGIPCLTLRENTERPVTISHGTNQLVTAANLRSTFENVMKNVDSEKMSPPLWDGCAGKRIARIVSDHLDIGTARLIRTGK
jgi:UDP-N-acetylglucosamine 2-epimerase (non-hydrolysing)